MAKNKHLTAEERSIIADIDMEFEFKTAPPTFNTTFAR